MSHERDQMRPARSVGSRASDRERAGCGLQGGLDRRDEIAGRGRRELDRNTRRGAVRRVGEVDVERVLGHRMDRMVEIDRATVTWNQPLPGPFALPSSVVWTVAYVHMRLERLTK